MDGDQIPFSLSASEIAALIDQVAASDVATLRLRTDEFELYIGRGEAPGPGPTVSAPSISTAEPAAATAIPNDDDLPRAAAAAPPADDSVAVSAPVVGMFYRRASPDEEPFVEVGSRVQPSTTVALVETMKVFTSVMAGVRGVVVSIDVDDQDAVEAGQALMRIAPDEGEAGASPLVEGR